MNDLPGVWDGALIAVKALTYAGALCSAGAVFFLGYCGSLITAADRSRIRNAVWGLSLLSIAGGAAQIVVSAGSMSATVSGMWDGPLLHMIWQAGAGRVNAIRDAGLVLAALGAASGTAPGTRPGTAPGVARRPPWWSTAGALAAATSFAWQGHARSLLAESPAALHAVPGLHGVPGLPMLPVLLVGVHLLCVAFWLGALPALGLIAQHGDAGTAAAPVARFGGVAMVVVAALTAAGLGLSWMMLGDFAQLWRSGYGRLLMLKLTLVAVLLCLAAVNKLNLTPRLLGGDARALQALRTSIRVELLLGALILLATATLTTVTGPPALDESPADAAAARELQCCCVATVYKGV